MRAIPLLLVIAGLAACASVPAPPQFHRTEAQAKAGYPFSSAVQAGPWLILSGDIGVEESIVTWARTRGSTMKFLPVTALTASMICDRSASL